LDQSGRTGILIFSGYYGWWLGAAIHEGWDLDWNIENKDKEIPVAPLISTPLSIFFTYMMTQNKNISHANTSIISLGGHLGTWQGLGWAEVSGAESHEVIKTGTLAGLGGIGLGLICSNNIKFTPGGATLTHSGLFFGAWLGFVSGYFFEHDDEALLTDMLIGSDIFVLTSGIMLRKSSISRRDAWGLNVLTYGGALIPWVVYWGYTTEEDKYDSKTGVAVAGIGSIAGLVIGNILLDLNSGKLVSGTDQSKADIYCSINPDIILSRSDSGQKKYVPGLSFLVVR
jgi:hypothetical protein